MVLYFNIILLIKLQTFLNNKWFIGNNILIIVTNT